MYKRFYTKTMQQIKKHPSNWVPEMEKPTISDSRSDIVVGVQNGVTITRER